MQRNPTVGVAFGPRHLGTAEATGDLDLDPFGAGAHRRGQGAFHRAAEGDAVLQLLGDRLGDQLGVELGALDLADVHFHRRAGELVQLFAQRVDFTARLADDDAGASGVNVDGDLAAALDRDVREPRVRELVDDVVANLQVFLENVGKVLLLEPGRLPVMDVSDAETLRVDLLSHQMPAFPAQCAWGPDWPSRSRTQDEAVGGAKGESEDAEMGRARRVIQVCWVGKAGISLVLYRG